MSAAFLFDMVVILMFPFLGHWLGMSDMAYGLRAGTAVNDTSGLVASGYAFSEAAGDFATMVKLTRMLSIIPTVLIFSVINVREKCRMNVAAEGERVNVLTLFPRFILGFLGLALFNSVGLIPAAASAFLKDLSKFLMVAAPAAIGLNTDFREMQKAGLRPMLHGFILSALVVVVALLVEMAMGLV